MNQASPLIELRDLTRTFETGGLAVTVLHGVSLTIHEGEFERLAAPWLGGLVPRVVPRWARVRHRR